MREAHGLLVLPASRNRTYGTDTPVNPGDLNDLQDAVISLKHGDVVETMSAIMCGPCDETIVVPNPIAPRLSLNGAVTVMWALPMKEGDRLKSLTFSHLGNGTADITAVTVRKTTAAGVATTIGSGSSTNPPASWTDVTIDISPDATIAAGEAITVDITTNATGISIGNLRWTKDRP